MIDTNTEKKEKPKLIFDEKGNLREIIITSEKLEGQQVKMKFVQKNRKTSLDRFQWIGDYIPTDDSEWIPGRFFKLAIRQARAIFADYREKEKNKVQ